VIQLGGACARHRPALLDFVDRAEIGPDTGAALGHLDQCPRCTAELEAIVLTITALHRIGDEAGRLEPAADAWPRLEDRLTRWRPARWKIMSPIAGVGMSLALVAVLVVPLQFGAIRGASAPSPNLDRVVPSPAERRIEANYIWTSHQGILPAPESATRSTGSGPRKYPDDTRPERKEVAPAEPSGRPPEAI
jgi:anti-sigma factor RsiW